MPVDFIESPRVQAERIYEFIENDPDLDETLTTVEEIEARIDPDLPRPVNFKRLNIDVLLADDR